uniref:ATP synthase subunit a n=1 Tax=Notocrater youngi TaxID=2813390 RepID=A0A894K5R6_9VEST|nr:ATP synthase F0 subunit 6 [Notocrater youngi]
MLVDIFSSFDDHNSTLLSMYISIWLCSFFVLFTASCFLFVDLGRWSYLINLPSMVSITQVGSSFGKKLGGFSSVISTLFLFLLLFNLSGLIPYVFSNTSHLAVTLSLGLPIWMSLIISSVFRSPRKTAAGLLPESAPAVLSPFLVLVETVSLSVRPITLSVRLAANMSAGHIVLGLLGGYLSSGIFEYSYTSLSVLIIVQIGYFMFEVGISIIQAYIFSLLAVLYSDDHAS